MMTGTACSSPTTTSIGEFYDADVATRINEFVNVNPRIEAAGDFIASYITTRTRRLLDVGCGLGVTTARFRSSHPQLLAHGIDISARNIEAARTLHAQQRVRFDQGDMTTVPQYAPYDIIALMDVYEHVPRRNWPALNKILGQAMATDGILLMTAPTPLTQEWFAEKHPEFLQVVDETITIDDVLTLARDVGGVVTKYEMVSIGFTNDYFHLAIERTPRFERVEYKKSWWQRSLSGVSTVTKAIERGRRRRFIFSKLQIRV